MICVTKKRKDWCSILLIIFVLSVLIAKSYIVSSDYVFQAAFKTLFIKKRRAENDLFHINMLLRKASNTFIAPFDIHGETACQ